MILQMDPDRFPALRTLLRLRETDLTAAPTAPSGLLRVSNPAGLLDERKTDFAAILAVSSSRQQGSTLIEAYTSLSPLRRV